VWVLCSRQHRQLALTETDVAVFHRSTKERFVLRAWVWCECPCDVSGWSLVLWVAVGGLIKQRDGHWTRERPAEQRVVRTFLYREENRHRQSTTYSHSMQTAQHTAQSSPQCSVSHEKMSIKPLYIGRTGQGLPPPSVGHSHYFSFKFFGQKPAAKNKKNCIY